ncbi:hypothetical protein [Stutzerimonas kirkiae]|uniref:hypothetical protein n=1 Tax=Stutzerimonas kirkiae TaxID=2211392 RepID=UPI0010380E59|nr:hypothetical protein [Stutzerimonas kirkiae]
MQGIHHPPARQAQEKLRHLSEDAEARRPAFVRERALHDKVRCLKEAREEGHSAALEKRLALKFGYLRAPYECTGAVESLKPLQGAPRTPASDAQFPGAHSALVSRQRSNVADGSLVWVRRAHLNDRHRYPRCARRTPSHRELSTCRQLMRVVTLGAFRLRLLCLQGP